jgi:hypothetical protein
MAGVPEGRVEDAHSGETPPSGPNDGARERNQPTPLAQLEQLLERQKELEEACLVGVLPAATEGYTQGGKFR